MKKYILVFALVALLGVSFASAIWPFDGSITGNVVDGQSIDVAGCIDSDGGFLTDVPGFVGAVFNGYDSCAGGRVTRYVYIDGVLTRVNGFAKIKEFYCDPETGKKSSELRSSEDDDMSEGICILELTDISGRSKKLAKWLQVDPICTNVSEGVLMDENGKRYKDRCVGKNYYQYSCSENGSIQEEITTCANKCNANQGGCIGTCSAETDIENDIDVPGSLDVDGVVYLDECHPNGNAIKQYTCNDGKMEVVQHKIVAGKAVSVATASQSATLVGKGSAVSAGTEAEEAELEGEAAVLVPVTGNAAAAVVGTKIWGSCGTNRICVDSEEGAYCKDLYASADSVSGLSSLTEEDVREIVQEELSSTSAFSKQEIFEMFRAYSLGDCSFMSVPLGSALDESDDDYAESFIDADANGDGVVTGIEWAESLDSICLYGFRADLRYVPGGSSQYILNPIGCAGGSSTEELAAMEDTAIATKYLFCTP